MFISPLPVHNSMQSGEILKNLPLVLVTIKPVKKTKLIFMYINIQQWSLDIMNFETSVFKHCCTLCVV